MIKNVIIGGTFMKTLIIMVALLFTHMQAHTKPRRTDYISKSVLLKELKEGRALAKRQCFRRPSENFGQELKTSEYCGAYVSLDLLIFEINAGKYEK